MRNTKQDLSDDDNGLELQIEDDVKYIDSILLCSIFYAGKLISFAFLRYFLHLNNLGKKSESDLLLPHQITNLLVFFYIVILIGYGALHEKLPSHLLIIMNTVACLFELLIVLNSDYSTVAFISMVTLATFFAIIGLSTKILRNFKMGLSFALWFLCGSVTLVLLFIFAYDDFHKDELGFMNFNIFLGLYCFGVWSIIYFADYINMDHIGVNRMIFVAGEDFYRMISSMALDLHKEYNI